MTKINVVRDNKGFIWEFQTSGHAGFAPQGEDIVCAAVSVLAQTAVGAMQDLIGEKYFSYKIKNGYLKCTVSLDIPEELKEKTLTILETIVIGFKQIELTYGKYVSVLDEEV